MVNLRPIIEFSTDGPVTKAQHDHAVDVVLKALGHRELLVMHARFRLESPEGPNPRPAHARVVVDLPGKLLVVQADAADLDEAIVRMGAKLAQRIEHTYGRRISKQRRAVRTPDAWHHGDMR